MDLSITVCPSPLDPAELEMPLASKRLHGRSLAQFQCQSAIFIRCLIDVVLRWLMVGLSWAQFPWPPSGVSHSFHRQQSVGVFSTLDNILKPRPFLPGALSLRLQKASVLVPGSLNLATFLLCQNRYVITTACFPQAPVERAPGTRLSKLQAGGVIFVLLFFIYRDVALDDA